MTTVPYNYMSGFILTGYKPLFVSLFNKDLTFTFVDYVKSQIHMPFTLDLYGRDITSYVNALSFIEGDDRYLEDCGVVLKLFYQDMLDMLCAVLKNKPSLKHTIKIEVNLGRETPFPKKTFSLEKTRKELEGILSFENIDWENGLGGGILVRFSDSEIDSLEPNNMLALASILTHFHYNESEPAILEVL